MAADVEGDADVELDVVAADWEVDAVATDDDLDVDTLAAGFAFVFCREGWSLSVGRVPFNTL